MPAAWSEVELLLEKDFARYTEAEMAPARELIARLARRHPTRLSRRTRPSRRRGHAPGPAPHRARVAADRRESRSHRRWRAPTQRPRQLVLVCDVSGSMAPYARMLLQYMHACVAARRRVEAFAFGTRLTRITHELAGRDHDRALDRAAAAVTDFSGGTRIGAALAELNRVHGRRLGRGAVVVILSDGWDRGDPEQLEREMARLRRARPPAGVAEPARRPPGLRAADPRDARRGAAHRPAAGGQLAGVAGAAGSDPGGDVSAAHALSGPRGIAGLDPRRRRPARGIGERAEAPGRSRRPAAAGARGPGAVRGAELERVVVVLGAQADRDPGPGGLGARRAGGVRGLGDGPVSVAALRAGRRSPAPRR